MGLISENKNDIFVSYAHLDDLAHIAPGWVDSFVKILSANLQVALAAEIRQAQREIKIFCDYKLDNTKPLPKELSREAENSEIILIVMSDHFLASDWCEFEFARFANKFAVDHDDDLPCAIVNLQETDREKWPNELQDIPGEKFYDHTKGSIVSDPRYAYPNCVSNQSDGEFWRALNSLQGALAHKIKAMLKQVVPPPLPPAPREEVSVFLASETEDMDHYCAQLKEELLERGVPFVECENGPGGSDGQNTFQTQISNSVLFIQLLGITNGRSGLNFPNGKVLSQHQAADGISQMFAVREEFSVTQIDPHETEYKRFVESQMPDVFRGSPQDFANSIEDKFLEIVDHHNHSDRSKIQLYVDALEDDLGHAQTVGTICRKLSQTKGMRIACVLPEQSQPNKCTRGDWKERASTSNGVLLVYGAVERDWVIGLLDDLEEMKFAQEELGARPPLRGVLDMPPTGSVGIVDEEITVIDCTPTGGPLTPEKIWDFIENCRGTQ